MNTNCEWLQQSTNTVSSQRSTTAQIQFFYSSSSDLHNSGLIIFSLFLIKNNKLDSIKCNTFPPLAPWPVYCRVTDVRFVTVPRDSPSLDFSFFHTFFFRWTVLLLIFQPWHFASHPSWINSRLNELHIKPTLFVATSRATVCCEVIVVMSVGLECWIMFHSKLMKRDRVLTTISDAKLNRIWTEKK